MRFKDHFVPQSYLINKEIYDSVRNQDDILLPPVRNMRHINPVRQSGPLPAYSGTYTMEDIKKVFDGTHIGYDFNYCQMDVDELMRRVPGVPVPSSRSPGKKRSTSSSWGSVPSSKSTTPTLPTTTAWMCSTCPMRSTSPGRS